MASNEDIDTALCNQFADQVLSGSPRKSRRRVKSLHCQGRHRSEGRRLETYRFSPSSELTSDDFEDYNHARLRVRPLSNKSSNSNYSSCSTKSKSCTSKWDVLYLQKFRIYYHSSAHPLPTDILDLIYKRTGVFGPLSDDQKKHVDQLKSRINFSCSVADLISCRGLINIEQKLKAEVQIDIDNIQQTPNALSDTTVTEDFINSTKLMVQYQVDFITQAGRETPVPEDVFVDIYRAFVKMCGLYPVPGSAWKSCMSIHGSVVISESDIVVMKKNLLDGAALSFVSIAQIKNLNKYIDGKQLNASEERSGPRRTTGSKHVSCNTDDQDSYESEPVVCQDPEIYEKISPAVLGQHGGELLIHYNLFGEKLSLRQETKYLPGMIVVGTEVTFTVLVMNSDHLRELTGNDVCVNNKAYIYYSEPKDMLKKEDRDLLFEAFARFNN